MSRIHRCQKNFCVAIAICLTTQFVVVSLVAQDPDARAKSPWTQFRGTAGSGTIEGASHAPVQIDLATQTVWNVELPGTGWSSPVYDNGKIWLTTAVTQKASAAEIAKKLKGDRLASIKTFAASVELRALCLDLKSGKVILDILLSKVDDPQSISPLNSYASPTPAISHGKVVCHFGNYGTWCLDAETGKQLWKTAMVVDHSVGPGSSPVVVDGRVVIVCDGTDQQYIVAIDLATGKEAWKVDRPPIRATEREYRKAYSTPVMFEIDGKQQMVVPGAQWLVSYDPKTGSELWRADHGKGFSVTPMPVYESGLIIFSTGYTSPEFVAVDPRGSGDVTDSNIVWRTRNAPTMPSFIGRGGQLFAISDKGIMTCLDAKSGELIKRVRVGGNFSSSPILAGGNLYLCDRNGLMTIIRCSSDLETVSTTQFDSGIMASPVIFENDLLVRTMKGLIRIKGNR